MASHAILTALIERPAACWESPREVQLRARMKCDRSYPWLDVDPPTWLWPTH